MGPMFFVKLFLSDNQGIRRNNNCLMQHRRHSSRDFWTLNDSSNQLRLRH